MNASGEGRGWRNTSDKERDRNDMRDRRDHHEDNTLSRQRGNREQSRPSRSRSGSRHRSSHRHKSRSRSRDRSSQYGRGDMYYRHENREEAWRSPPTFREYGGEPPRGPPAGPGSYLDRGHPMDQRGGGSMHPPDRFRDDIYPQPPQQGHRFDDANGRDRNPRGGRRNEDTIGLSLLVRNISSEISQEDIRQAFGRIGEVRDVYIPIDYHSQQPKGFAFVEFGSHEQAQEARDEMDKFIMKGRMLEVVFAQERRKRPEEMKGRVRSQQDYDPPERRGGDGPRGGREYDSRRSDPPRRW